MRSNKIVFDGRRALQKMKIAIFQNFRRPRGPTKTANSDFSNVGAAHSVLQQLQTHIFQNDLFYYHLASWPRLLLLFVGPGRKSTFRSLVRQFRQFY